MHDYLKILLRTFIIHISLVIIHTITNYMHTKCCLLSMTLPRQNNILTCSYFVPCINITLLTMPFVQSGYLSMILIYRLKIISACAEIVWQYDASLETSNISSYRALLTIDMDCNCMTIDSGVYTCQC